MKLKTKTDRLGFTLAELLVVVAIIAVLVAVAIPVFTAATDKAEEAVCMANRRSWYGMLVTEALSEGRASEEFSVGHTGDTSSRAEYKQFVCPSGGKLSYTVKSDGSIEVSCSKHQELLYNAGSILCSSVESVQSQLAAAEYVKGKHIDSYATGNLKGWYSTVKGALPEGFSDNAPTWAILNDATVGMQFVWSTEAITLNDVGTKLPVICYNKESDNYSVGYSNVSASSNKLYPIIASENSYSPVGVTGSGYTKLNYEQAVSKYNALLEEYRAGK